MDKINIYINSKNRDLSESTSNFTVRIPQNLLRLGQGEYFTLNVNGFYCYNSWFNCTSWDWRIYSLSKFKRSRESVKGYY